MFTTAVTSALVMFALAGAISLLVAGLIKLLFVLVRRFGGGQ
ncbi:hypothetical protein Verru16b_01939 [Lacunisphaera limnophila]|uniref:Uncharacterized protein n=1 Tax=Lacunisphaera limnophila TaxID=1838286 RepID=A0A1D8AVE5_9BACT|nr:hypothetical protein [Lacunisphaera limnophila]AOS44870.1 hypothetical protein Verru16b_01939 [Lacunisphaera limnophila]